MACYQYSISFGFGVLGFRLVGSSIHKHQLPPSLQFREPSVIQLSAGSLEYMWEFPKIRGTILGVPIIRTIVFLGSILGTRYFGKLPCLFGFQGLALVECGLNQ